MEFRLEPSDIDRLADAVTARLLKTQTPNTTPEPDKLMDIPALMEYLGMSDRWVMQEIAEFRLPYFKIGRYIKFRKTEIDDYLRRCAVAPLRLPGGR